MWLEGVRHNPSVDFLFFTDTDQELNWPRNVKVFHTSLDKLRERFQMKFDFTICLDLPYKICDFIPAYGEIFADYLADYDFWGYIDNDTILGDIRAFLTDELLEKYDKLYSNGHCTIFRNTPVVNSYYRTLPANGYQDWKTVLSTHGSFAFDEWAGHAGGGISFIIKSNGIPYYDEPDMADLKIAYIYGLRPKHIASFTGYLKASNWPEITDKRLYFHYKTASCSPATAVGSGSAFMPTFKSARLRSRRSGTPRTTTCCRLARSPATARAVARETG